ncbi:MAG: TPM domain-containing protein [Bacteroidales bacterium]|nr:TPM domain-containing protein [Bacteroidales bacterium]HNW73789.1 TPM domain-containing protein [Bacteroidales bacterium]HPS50513.1 TPM domain-containing protein [Bacteroidales bacterium]
MIHRKLKYLLLFFIGLLVIDAGQAQDIPPRPDPPRLVNDFAGILTPEQINNLESKLVAFNDSTSTQLVVVTVKSLNGYDNNQFAYMIGQRWGVGQKGKNNGAVILVKPKYRDEKGEASIQTGYGLEGAIPDALSKRIVENEMIPAFREGNYYAGIDAAVNTMISLAKGEFTADQYIKRNKNQPIGIIIPIIIIAVVFMLMRGSRARSHSIGKNIPFWTAFWLLGSMGRGHSGSWNSFTGGSGFGGGGGGGFGGFGGGGFGGGGAGGSW